MANDGIVNYAARIKHVVQTPMTTPTATLIAQGEKLYRAAELVAAKRGGPVHGGRFLVTTAAAGAILSSHLKRPTRSGAPAPNGGDLAVGNVGKSVADVKSTVSDVESAASNVDSGNYGAAAGAAGSAAQSLANLTGNKTVGTIATVAATTGTAAADVSSGNYVGAAGAVAGAIGNALGSGHGAQVAATYLTDIAEGAAYGAMIGNAIPIPGVGAAVGAIVGVIAGALDAALTEAFTHAIQPPQGEFRSKAEQIVFPSWPIAPKALTATGTDEAVIQPGVWATYRSHAVGFQPTDFTLGNPGPGQTDLESAFSVAIGWSAVPKSTKGSRTQAYLLAQLMIAQDSVSQAVLFAATPDNRKTMQAWISAVQTACLASFEGSQAQMNTAMALLKSMYLSPFKPATSGDEMDEYNIYAKNPNLTPQQLQALPAQWNSEGPQSAISDYVYYVFDTQLVWQKSNGTNQFLPANQHYFDKQTKFFMVPDTAICGLAEICSMAASGMMPIEGIYAIAFHYVMKLCYAWKKAGGSGTHPNFMRLLGLLTQRIHEQQAEFNGVVPVVVGSAPAASVHGESRFGVDAIMRGQESSQQDSPPWGAIMLTVAALYFGGRVLQQWDKPRNEDRDEQEDARWRRAHI